jgi:hypothetical protein
MICQPLRLLRTQTQRAYYEELRVPPPRPLLAQGCKLLVEAQAFAAAAAAAAAV